MWKKAAGRPNEGPSRELGQRVEGRKKRARSTELEPREREDEQSEE